MKSITIGNFEITSLTDISGPFFRLDQLFPGVRAGYWEPYFQRYPWTFADRHTLNGRVGSYLLRSYSRLILVDTGVGPGGMGMQGRLMKDLESNGVSPEDIDTVFLTHLHGDHLGWSVKPDGEPVFSEARYITQVVEWEASASYLGRPFTSLDDLGVLDLLDGEEALTEELTVIPTPGHSPGHASLLVSSGGKQVLIAGDAITHPAQVTEPTWNIHFDMDKEQTAFTREMLFGWLEADGIAVAAGHIPGSGFGRIAREDGRRYWHRLETISDLENLPLHLDLPEEVNRES